MCISSGFAINTEFSNEEKLAIETVKEILTELSERMIEGGYPIARFCCDTVIDFLAIASTDGRLVDEDLDINY